MAKQVLNNGETHGVIRGKANDNFTELYNSRDTHLADNVTDADGAHGLKIESGSFTPFLYGDAVVGAPTYISRSGVYYKIGKLVIVRFSMQISNKGGMSGNLFIGGLPFTSDGSYSVHFPTSYGLSMAAGCVPIGYTSFSEVIHLGFINNLGGGNITDALITNEFAIWAADCSYKIA